MKFEKTIPMFYTEQLEKTVKFYSEVIGFHCHALDVDAGWASVARDKVELMFATPNEHLKFDKPVFTGSIYLKVIEVETLWDQLKDRCEICYPLESFDYGMKEFAIYDNNGYMIQFGQEIDPQHS